MEVLGKIICVLDAKQGVSKTGKDWYSQEYVIETFDQYPKKVCFSVFGKDKNTTFGIQVGQTLKVSFDIDAKEYNGRWFNSLNAWNVESGENAVASAPPVNIVIPTIKNSAPNSLDDLPF